MADRRGVRGQFASEKLQAQSGVEVEAGETGDANLDVFKYLSAETVESTRQKIKDKQKFIDSLLEQFSNDPDKLFFEIFGIKSTGMQMEVRPYGIYFYDNYDSSSFDEIVEGFSWKAHGAAFIASDTAKLLKRKDLLGMVGFGTEHGADHEFVHMFNTNLPLHDVFKTYEEIQPNVSMPLDGENIRLTKELQYQLWSDSHLKDEFLARIDDEKILQAEEQKFDDVYSGGGRLFTTYEPGRLYDYMSNYKTDAAKYGLQPISREESDRFWGLYDTVVDPIRKRYLDSSNANIRAIKKALGNRMEKAKIKAIIIESPFVEIAEELEKAA